MAKPSYLNFDHKNYGWKSFVNYRANPHLYRVGRGEQGVLTCQPYKSEILPYWKFKTPAVARDSSEKIYSMFLNYLRENDFIGADMARKFLQMGFTRSRRYANYKGGRKYNAQDNYKQNSRGTGDILKIESANIFLEKYRRAMENKEYLNMRKEWQKTTALE